MLPQASLSPGMFVNTYVRKNWSCKRNKEKETNKSPEIKCTGTELTTLSVAHSGPALLDGDAGERKTTGWPFAISSSSLKPCGWNEYHAHHLHWRKNGQNQCIQNNHWKVSSDQKASHEKAREFKLIKRPLRTNQDNLQAQHPDPLIQFKCRKRRRQGQQKKSHKAPRVQKPKHQKETFTKPVLKSKAKDMNDKGSMDAFINYNQAYMEKLAALIIAKDWRIKKHKTKQNAPTPPTLNPKQT